jgi:hypothetical protein
MAKTNIGIETSSWINMAGGILVAIIAYYQTPDLTNNPFLAAVIPGALLVALGAYTAWAAATGRSKTTMWPSVGSALLGVWLLGYPWFASVSSTYLYTVSGTGLVVAIVSAYEMWASGSSERPRAPTA